MRTSIVWVLLVSVKTLHVPIKFIEVMAAKRTEWASKVLFWISVGHDSGLMTFAREFLGATFVVVVALFKACSRQTTKLHLMVIEGSGWH